MAAERETLDVDVLIVGGGPAGMSAALRLAQLQKEKGGEPLRSPCSRRRARPARTCCRAPCSIRRRCAQLVPDFKAKGAPLASEVHHDHVYFLTRGGKVTFPITPPPLVESRQLHHLAQPVREVARRPGRSRGHRRLHRVSRASRSCTTGDRVVGVRTGDRGIGKHGERKSTFEPGVDIRAKVTILTDGVRGNLTKAVVRRLALDAGRQPQLYALGIKELWEVPAGSASRRAR